jgi:metal-responsive CopG/Arc/MetJ family transcriptional regulator
MIDPKRKVSVSTVFDLTLLEDAEVRAKAEGKSRSQFIREAVEMKLREEEAKS